MVDLTPAIPSEPTRTTLESYFALAEGGVLGPDDRVELLEGVIVAMTPSNPPHAAAVSLITHELGRVVGDRAAVRTQCTLVLAPHSAPEPDVAIVPGSHHDYATAHPTSALLIVEVADTSLQQDRLTKAKIYAAAGVPEYWIVNLRSRILEIMRDPDRERALYRDVRSAGRDERIALVAIPQANVAVQDLFPRLSAGI